MGEENVDSTNDSNATVSDEEMKKVEEQIQMKDNKSQEELKKKIEADVREQVKKEQELKDLEANNKILEELVKKKEAEKTKEFEEMKAEIDRLKEESGTSKKVVTNNSPFRKEEDNTGQLDFKNLTKEQLKEIDEESKNAFKQHLRDTGQSLKGINDW